MKLFNITKSVVLIFIVFIQISCGNGDSVEERAKMLFTSLQNLDIDDCVQMSYLYKAKLDTIQNEPQFKKNKLIADIALDIKKTTFNQYYNDSIVYIFRFPCQWKILESKILSQDSSNSLFTTISEFYRVFVVVNYNSIENSPISVPLITEDTKSEYHIKEIILHCDFDKETMLFLGWGLDSHTGW